MSDHSAGMVINDNGTGTGKDQGNCAEKFTEVFVHEQIVYLQYYNALYCKTMANEGQQADEILDTALMLAQHSGWEQLCLFDIARELEIGLQDIYRHYGQKDDLVDAWFDRADRTMLASASGDDFLKKTVPERLETLILAWLDALALHKRITGEMLWYKLEPGHVHLQWAALLRISRTVQWLREAAGQDSIQLVRVIEEVGLSTIYVAVFVYWLNDVSDGQERTRSFLRSRLQQAGHCLHFCKSVFPGTTDRGREET